MKNKLIGIVLFSALALVGCAGQSTEDPTSTGDTNSDGRKSVALEEQQTAKEKTVLPSLLEKKNNQFEIVAKEASHLLTSDLSVPVWTFNGSVPGPQIRVKVGEDVKVKLVNELPDPVTIHWHGIPVPNNMDGIPGITMNAVQPGENFVYEFTAEDTGTYWYHSHQDGVNQVDKGLYGSFVVEDKTQEEIDRDYTLVLDEWMSNPDSMNMENEATESDSDNMEGMDHEGMDMESDMESESGNMEGMDHDMSEYDIFTINGKSGASITPLPVTEGEKVRIRLVNAGFMSHSIHLHGHDFKVVSSDGQEITNPQTIRDQSISIAPGERYDIEFTADNPGDWLLECHGDMQGTDGMKIAIQYEDFDGATADKSNNQEELETFDLAAYGEKEPGVLTLNQDYDVSYTMDLNTRMAEGGTEYTINEEVFPETENIKVNEGDLVKVKLVNNSMMDDHPMHLHGHFFQVLSKNGEPIQGSPILKDTLNLKPGEEYEVAFIADNPGNWLFHCHDLHHASAGMVTQVQYDGFTPDFIPNPEANNQPE